MPPEFNSHFSTFLRMFSQQLATIVPPTTDIAAAFESGTDDQQAFVQNLALFYTGFFRVRRLLVGQRWCCVAGSCSCVLDGSVREERAWGMNHQHDVYGGATGAMACRIIKLSSPVCCIVVCIPAAAAPPGIPGGPAR
jgi:hypothetical protein